MEGYLGGLGVSEVIVFMKLIWNFQGGGEIQTKKIPMGGVWRFFFEQHNYYFVQISRIH